MIERFDPAALCIHTSGGSRISRWGGGRRPIGGGCQPLTRTLFGENERN